MGTRHLGMEEVRGKSLVPLPATRMNAFNNL